MLLLVPMEANQKQPLYLIELEGAPIFEQLKIEEALIRTSEKNFCLINRGSPPAIVMGISGKSRELIYEEKVAQANMPLIRRFSGGGTVVVDHNTLFVSFLFSSEAHPFSPYPQQILTWSETLYQEAIPSLQLRENDYIIGKRKIGGNAQYIRKGRWLHHTTFLWDYDSELMGLLKLPTKRPDYRADRSHEDFIDRLASHLPSKETLPVEMKRILSQKYQLQTAHQMEIDKAVQTPHRQSTMLVEIA